MLLLFVHSNLDGCSALSCICVTSDATLPVYTKNNSNDICTWTADRFILHSNYSGQRHLNSKPYSFPDSIIYVALLPSAHFQISQFRHLSHCRAFTSSATTIPQAQHDGTLDFAGLQVNWAGDEDEAAAGLLNCRLVFWALPVGGMSFPFTIVIRAFC